MDLSSFDEENFTFTMPASDVSVEIMFFVAADPDAGIYFTDIDLEEDYYTPLRWAFAMGITCGTSETTFSPELSCSRAQFVSLLWRAMGSPTADNQNNPFEDVSADNYYYEAVRWAVAQGITSGTSATTFSPDAPVTRAQTATFLYNAAGKPGVSETSFDDVASGSYYANAVVWAVEQGITGETGINLFRPADACTRAQIVTFLFNHMAK
jgi:hypothetical protein